MDKKIRNRNYFFTGIAGTFGVTLGVATGVTVTGVPFDVVALTLTALGLMVGDHEMSALCVACIRLRNSRNPLLKIKVRRYVKTVIAAIMPTTI